VKFTWAEAVTKFAAKLSNFERRDNQDALANRIEQSLESFTHIFAQAGCGTGKSFAGAVPAIAHSKKTGRPVIIATATKALQSQLVGKDLPFLKDTLGDFTYVDVRGRSNYVCHAKLDELNDAQLKSAVHADLDSNPGHDGLIESLPEVITPQERALLSTTSDECPGKSECPFGEVCFAEKAKTKAKTANVVVVNHAVLAADLSIKAHQKAVGVPEDKVTGMLPNFSGAIIDEAHELVDFVTSALGGEVTAGSYGRLGKMASNFLSDRDALKAIDKVTDVLFGQVQAILNTRQDKRSKTVLLTDVQLAKLAESLTDLYKELMNLRKKVEGFVIHGDDKAAQKKKRLIRRIESSSDKVNALLVADQSELVRWVELGEGKKGNSINWAPLSVADFLREELLSVAPVAFMSATLAVSNDFTALADQIGVEKYATFDAGTPFDFETQARTFIPQIAHPAGATINQWRSSASAITGELLRASNGRALLLFTSRTEMEEAYRTLAPSIEGMGHKALMQGQFPNKVLKERFDADEHSVLFGMDSFMTGIDIQGDSLRLVVLNKAPFKNLSDVVFKARMDALDAKYGAWKPKGGFYGLYVPTMALKLYQAFGRLIRTVDDRGVVAILDSRLFGKTAKGYAPVVVKGLPNAPILTDLGETTEFLEGLELAA
jgi:ATP-dependent DNA helicase DinG